MTRLPNPADARRDETYVVREIGVRLEGGRLSWIIQANFGRDELPSRGRLPGGLGTVEQDRGERFEQPSQTLIRPSGPQEVDALGE